MKDKKVFLKLWEWAEQYFQRKATDRFLKEGIIPNDEHSYSNIKELYMVRKCFQTINDGLTTEHWLKIEYLITEPFKDFDPVSDMIKELKK